MWTVRLHLRNPATKRVIITPGYLAYVYPPPVSPSILSVSTAMLSGGVLQTNTIVELHTICEHTSLNKFPFDTQTCEIQLAYDDAYYQYVNFLISNETKYLAVRPQSNNDEWMLQKVYLTQSRSTSYKVNASIRLNHGFNVVINVVRNNYYYVMTLLVPAIVVLGLSALTFLLPSDDGEKIILGATILTAADVLKRQVMTLIPHVDSENVPHLVIALEAGFVLSAISVAEAVCIQTARIITPDLPGHLYKCINWLFKKCCAPGVHTNMSRNILRQTDTIQSSNTDNIITEHCTTTTTSASTSECSGDPSVRTVLICYEMLFVMRNQLGIERHKIRRKERGSSVKRAWRRLEYLFNFLALTAYIAAVVYLFGIYVL